MANKVGEVILQLRFAHEYYHYEVYYLKDATKGMEGWEGHDSYWVVFTYMKEQKQINHDVKPMTLGQMHAHILNTLKEDKYNHYSVIKNNLPHEVWDIAKREHMMLNL